MPSERRPAGTAVRHARAGTGPLRLALLGVGLLLAAAGIGGVTTVLVGVFTASTASGSSLALASLDSWLPSGVTTSRATATTCQVSWTPHGSAPVGATYDITDGTTTLASDVAGSATVVTAGAGTVTPVVKLRVGSWVSSSGTTAASACQGWPDAPVLTVTPSQTQLSATWTAPAGNGTSVVSYSATVSPAGSGTTSCSVVVPASRSCVFTGLTDGVTYTVSVTATSAAGTGPAGTATAIPYPSSVLTAAATTLWLDAADTSTLYASSSCSGAGATTTVGCWADKSNQVNNATQSTGSKQPALTSSGLPRSAPGFDGVDDELVLSPAVLPNGSTASTAFHVVQLTDATPASSSYRTVLAWGQSATGKKRIMAKNASSAAVFADSHGGSSSTPGSLTTGRTTLVESEYSASRIRTGMDGDAWLSPASTTVNTGTSYAYLGSVSSNFYWQGPIPEVIVLTGTVSDADRRTVEEYLARKWSLTITPAAPTAVTVSPTATGTGADITWTVPSWNGGSVITGYTVTAVPVAGGSTITCTAVHPATSCTLSGLAGSGAQYTVTVAATNAVGTGPASSSVTMFAGLPVSTGLSLWLDGADAASMYASWSCSGAAATTIVGCWKDKSGNADHAAQGVSGWEPTLGTLNGYRVPTFAGMSGSSSLAFSVPSTLPSGGTGSVTFIAASQDAAMGFPTAVRWSGSPPTGTGRSWFLNTASNPPVPCVDTASSGPSACSATTVSQGVPFVLSSEVTATSLDISADATTAATAGGAISTQNAGGGLGNWQGPIPEVIVYSGSLTTAQRRSVEEYLATKWGITIAPSAPQSPTAAPGNASATVSWTAPASTGGSAVTSYTVTPVGGPGTCTWSAGVTASCTGLTNGVSYTFSVAAVNAVGTGTAAGTAAVTPITVPGAPTGVVATADDTVSSVSWVTPASDGGSAITSYTATATPTAGTGSGSLPTPTCSAASSPCTLSGLTNGITYSVSVTATSAAGTGSASTGTSVVPYPRTAFTSGVVKLWLDGADPATLYASSGCTGAAATTTVGCWADKSGQNVNPSQSTAASRPTLTTVAGRQVPGFDGVDDGLTFDAALLPTGTASSTVAAAATLTNPNTATGYDNIISWGTGPGGGMRQLQHDATTTTARLDTDGSGLAVVGGTWSGSAATVAVADLSGGSTAHLSVSGSSGVTASGSYSTTGTAGAIGRKGASAKEYWSGPVDELIVTANVLSSAERRQVEEYLARKWGGTITPAAPASPSATVGNATATVSWSAPSWDGGASVTSYTVIPVGGGGSCTWSGGTTAACTGLTNGTSYTFTVAAVNSVGTGPTSATASVVPMTVPGAPTGVAATADDTVSSVSWTAPASSGGSAITSYTATAVPSDGSLATKTCSSASSPCSLSGLTNGALYTVTVTATNAVGTGSASGSATVTPYPKGIMTGATLNLWLDGADSSTLYASSTCSGAAASTTIGCWQDKSASADDATQGTAGNQPTLSTLNGRVSPTFDGVDDYAALTVAKLVTGTNPSAVYAVAVQEDTSPASSCYRHIIGWGAGSANQGRVLEKGCNSSNAYLETFGSWASISTPPTWPVSSAALMDGVVTSSTISGSMNGAGAYSISNGNNTGTSSGAHVGDSPWGGGTWKGRVAEIIVLAANPSASQNREIEEYLARKWGMTITPAAAQSASAVAGTGTATVSWSAPSWNGGASVSSYTVTPVGGPGSCTWSSGTTASCTGLTHGVPYSFTVAAANSVGTGPSTTTAAVTA